MNAFLKALFLIALLLSSSCGDSISIFGGGEESPTSQASEATEQAQADNTGFLCDSSNYEAFVKEPDKILALIEETGQTCYLQGVDFSGKDLSGYDFSYSDLSYANFTLANLTGTNFTGADISFAVFIRSILERTIFVKAKAEGANFQKTYLYQADFEDTILTKATYSPNYKMRPHYVWDFMSYLNSFGVEDPESRGMISIAEQKLEETAENNQNLETQPLFCDSSNYEAFVKEPDKILALIEETGQACYLQGVDFSGKDLSGYDFSYSDLSYANLSSANLEEANFTGADLTSANLTGANVKSANFMESLLKETIFVKAKAEEANFQKTYLYQADFEGTILAGATYSPDYRTTPYWISVAFRKGYGIKNPESRGMISVKRWDLNEDHYP